MNYGNILITVISLQNNALLGARIPGNEHKRLFVEGTDAGKRLKLNGNLQEKRVMFGSNLQGK